MERYIFFLCALREDSAQGNERRMDRACNHFHFCTDTFSPFLSSSLCLSLMLDMEYLLSYVASQSKEKDTTQRVCHTYYNTSVAEKSCVFLQSPFLWLPRNLLARNKCTGAKTSLDQPWTGMIPGWYCAPSTFLFLVQAVSSGNPSLNFCMIQLNGLLETYATLRQLHCLVRTILRKESASLSEARQKREAFKKPSNEGRARRGIMTC